MAPIFLRQPSLARLVLHGSVSRSKKLDRAGGGPSATLRSPNHCSRPHCGRDQLGLSSSSCLTSSQGQSDGLESNNVNDAREAKMCCVESWVGTRHRAAGSSIYSGTAGHGTHGLHGLAVEGTHTSAVCSVSLPCSLTRIYSCRRRSRTRARSVGPTVTMLLISSGTFPHRASGNPSLSSHGHILEKIEGLRYKTRLCPGNPRQTKPLRCDCPRSIVAMRLIPPHAKSRRLPPIASILPRPFISQAY